MRKYYLLFGLLLPSLLRSQPIAVMLDKMNVLYVGVPNDLTAVVSDIPAERLVLTPSQGEIVLVDTSRGTYQWKICNMTSKQAWLILADSSADCPVDTLFFRLKQLPEPRFSSGGSDHFHGTLPRYGIVGYFDGFCSEWLRPQIVGFDATFLPKGYDILIKHNNGARFTGEVREQMQKMRRGDEVHFYNIVWTGGCDPTLRRSNEVLTFKVK